MVDSDNFKEVLLRCPLCGRKGKIQVSKKLIESSRRGICAIEVGKNQICSDSFVAYIDKNFSVRDYFIPDITLEDIEVTEKKIPSKEVKPVKEKKEISDEDFSIVRNILQRRNFTYIIHVLFLNKPIHVIYEVQDLHDKIIQAFGEILENTFNMQMTAGNLEDYTSNKKKFKDIIILDISSEKILEDYRMNISRKVLNFETEIISKAFKQIDPTTFLIVLKNEIQKIFAIANNLKKLLQEELGKYKKKLYKREVLNELYRRDKIKITSKYLDFILEINKSHFGLNPEDYIIDAKDGVKDFFAKL